MSLKRAPIVFLNFSETESDFNVVNNAEETEDDDYYKFVESEYDKLQVENDSEKPESEPVPEPEPESEIEAKPVPAPKPIETIPEEPPKKSKLTFLKILMEILSLLQIFKIHKHNFCN